MEKEKKSSFLLRNPEDGNLNQYWYSRATIEAMVAEVVEHGAGGTAFLSTPSVYFSLPENTRSACKCFDIDDKWARDPGFVHYDFNRPEDIPETLRSAFDMVVIDPPFITEEVWREYATAARMLLKSGGGKEEGGGGGNGGGAASSGKGCGGSRGGSNSAGDSSGAISGDGDTGNEASSGNGDSSGDGGESAVGYDGAGGASHCGGVSNNGGDGRILASTISENAPLMLELLRVRPVAFKPSIPNLVYQYDFYTNYESPRLAKRNLEILED